MDRLWQDLRYTLRSFGRRPGFTAAAILTLGLGIGGVATMAGVMDAIYFRSPSGVRDADAVVRLYIVRDEGNITTSEGGPGSYVDYEAMRAATRAFSGLAAFSYAGDLDLGSGEEAQRIRGRDVTADFFTVLGVRPAAGRLFVETDAAQRRRVVVLSHDFWQRAFGGNPSIVGETLLLDGESTMVVGVAGEEFAGIGTESIDAWVTFAGTRSESFRTNALMIALRYVGRLRPGISGEQAEAGAAAALRSAAEAVPDLDSDPGVLIGPLNASRGPHPEDSVRVALWVAIATALVLLIACANVANLLLARATSRRRELAVRISLGAARRRIVRQLLTESLVLASGGAALGLLLALWGAEAANWFPVGPQGAGMNLRVITVAVAAALGSGVLFGLIPAIHSARVDPAAWLKDGGRAMRRGRGRARGTLVVVQVALALVVLAAAGLLARSLAGVHAVDAGLDADRLLVISVDLDDAGYGVGEQRAFYNAAVDRLSGLSGVAGVGLTLFPPLAGSGHSIGVGDVDFEGGGPYRQIVGPEFFPTVGTPIVRGRAFADDDHSGSAPVAILNETAARAVAATIPAGDALGACIPLGDQTDDGGCTRIVGIAADARHRYLQKDIVPYVFWPRSQHPIVEAGFAAPALLVRATDEPELLSGQARAAIQTLGPDLPYVEVEPMTAFFRSDIEPFRIGATLFSLFGMLALLIAVVGVYGVLAYAVAERTHEIGVRKSLGAAEERIIRLVVGQGMRPVALGLVAGVAGALALTRFLEALLFGISPRDPLVFAAVAAVVVAAALLASYLPARRATRVDPMVALRAE